MGFGVPAICFNYSCFPELKYCTVSRNGLPTISRSMINNYYLPAAMLCKIYYLNKYKIEQPHFKNHK